MKKKIKTNLLTKKRIRKTLIAGVLACVVSYGSTMPVYATLPQELMANYAGYAQFLNFENGRDVILGVGVTYDGKLAFWDKYGDSNDIRNFSAFDVKGLAPYTAGDGISISNAVISAKAGTNVTVDGNGINVTGNGSVASGDTGLIDGGKLYAEARPITEIMKKISVFYFKHKPCYRN